MSEGRNAKRRQFRAPIKPRLLALAISQAIATAASAATITVNTTADSTADDGFCTLREAVISANSDPGAPGDCVAGLGPDMIMFDSALTGQTITLTAAGQIDLTSNVTLQGPGADKLTISGNDATRLFGVTIDGPTAPQVTINDLTLTRGFASSGGAIDNQSHLTIRRSVVSNNEAHTGDGGAIWNRGYNLTIENSTFSGNTALVRGGAIDGEADTRIYNSTFSYNEANFGGALYTNTDRLHLSNATLSGNTANFSGEGFRSGADGVVYLSGTIVANSDGEHCVNFGSFDTNEFNLIEDGTCSPSMSGDPLLGPLADNGGPTPTHALLQGSPAIDPDPAVGFCTPDQRGALRPVDGDGDGTARCDTGAFEYLPPLIVDTVAPIVADGDCALEEAVENANDDALTHDDCAPGFEADTISFDPVLNGQTITLFFGEIDINGPLSIQGPGADQLTISGNSNTRIFDIDDGVPLVDSIVSISGMTLRDGAAGNGGALRNREDLTLSEVALTSNSASAIGGAIWNAAPLTISSSALVGSYATDDGGAIWNTDRLTISASTLSSNFAGANGGGIYTSDPLTISQSTLSANSAAGNGGGIYSSLFGVVEIADCTLSGNSAMTGGAVFLTIGDLANSTLHGNTAGIGSGGIHHESFGLQMTNIVVAGSVGGDCASSGDPVTNVNNLIEDGSCADNAVNLITGDPLLGPLADNGGPTLTHAPLEGSPVIDAGDDGECTTADQRGRPRPADGDGDGSATCDIGAVEFDELIFADGYEDPSP